MKKIGSYHLVLAVTVGALLGFIGGPVQILILWALAGIALGYIAQNMKRAIIGGALFGFVMSFVFMLHGYDGTDSIYTKLVPFVALGLFGAICGAILGTLGRLPQILLRSKTTASRQE